MSSDISVGRLTQSSRSEYDEYVKGHPAATICHDSRIIEVVEKTLGHSPRYLVASEKGRIAGVLPLFLVTSWWGNRCLVSIPWLDYGGALTDSPIIEECLFAAADRLSMEEKCDYVEMRSVTSQSPLTRDRTEKVTFRMDLSPGSEAIWSNFNAKLRNQVRKAEKSNLSTRFGGRELLEDFYAVFCRNMRDLGTPVWGRELFASILNLFGGAAEIVLVEHHDQVVGGGLLLKWRGQWYVPSASSYREARSMCPNHALYWSIIKRGADEGAHYFDFGRSTIDGPTYRFKRQWVPEPTQLTWQYILPDGADIPKVNPDNPKYRMLVSAWQKLPLPVANWLGPIVIKNFP